MGANKSPRTRAWPILIILPGLILGIVPNPRTPVSAHSNAESGDLLEACEGGPKRPFPQQSNYAGCIKPTNVSQEDLNDSVKSYYEYWKATYVRQSNGATPGGGYYVFMKGTGGTGDEITTSEAHGYGMIIFALMAGYDGRAKEFYDGMFNMYDKHRSIRNDSNMSWIIDKSERASKDSDSATDGDMDIAYSLLLADLQWGSGGSINYLAEARRMIEDGIKQSDLSLASKRTLLGDWSRDQFATRPSDWMTDHFKAYRQATGDAFWDEATSTVYSLIDQVTAKYSKKAGLMPDFVVGSPPAPAPPNFLEADTDGNYSWNSCRYPWRMATDVAHYNSPQARAAARKVMTWLIGRTGNDPAAVVTGYKLKGKPRSKHHSAAFTSPFVAASIVDSSYQAFLNAGWNIIKDWRESYYGDTINLLSMLLISGNWWAPA